jgi:hypothetical protein
MTYAEHLTAMTRALVDVARHGQQDLTDAEVDVALVARRGVLELLSTVHADLTGHRPHRGVVRIGELEAHPVQALGQALARHPRPAAEVAPSDAFLAPATSPAGQAWQQVARHALVAHHHWTAGDATPADEATAWAGVADLAAIARQLTVLDVELADVLSGRGPRRAEAASGLARAATSGVGVAGRETARLAAAGPIADAGPDRGAASASAPGRRILVARSGADLLATLHRFAEFLDGAVNVRPERLPHLAAAIARCALIARDLLPRADPSATALRCELHEHARLLREATTRPGSVVSLEPGDLRPLRQAAEAYQGARRHAAALGTDRRLLAGYLDALAGSTQALAAVVERSVATRRWLVPDHTTSLMEPVWTRWRAGDPVPYPVLAVRAAADHADTLRTVAAAWPRPSAPAQVRAVLARASGRATTGTAPASDAVVRRPGLPSQPITARSTSGQSPKRGSSR